MPFPSKRLLPLVLATLSFGACSDGDGGGTVGPPSGQTVDPCLRMDTIAVGQSRSGSLTGTDCQVGGSSVDRWFFRVDTTSSLQLDMESSNFDTFLEVQTTSGEFVAANDDWNGLNSRILHTFPPGRYRILARAYDQGASGSYRLSLAEGPDCSNEGDLSLGATVSGTLTPDDCLHQWGAVLDHWGFQLHEPTRVRLDLVSGDFDEIVLVMDPEGYILDGADWQHPSGHARLDIDLPAGEWRVAVASADPSVGGDYQLTADYPPPCTPGTELALGETLSGTVDGDDCVFDGWLLADSVHLQVEGETDVVLEVKSQDFQPFLFIFRDDGAFVAMDDAWDTPNLARVRTVLSPGGYAVYIARDAWAVPTGGYSFTASQVTCDVAGTVEVGTPVSGALDATDCLRSNGAYREDWEMTVDEEIRIRLDLTSSDFDTYLVLRDAQGEVVAEDDDGGIDRNARLDLVLPAGSYRVEASSWAPGAVGAYELAVTQPASAATWVAPPAAPEPKTLPREPELDQRLRVLRTRVRGEAPRLVTALRAPDDRKR